MRFPKTQKLYLYLGGAGESPSNCSKNIIARGGFNGGGDAGNDFNDDDQPGGGGGATDIRLISNSNLESLYSRILVAAGGSGSCFNTYGAPGGDLYGYQTVITKTKKFYKSQTNQTNGFSLGNGAKGKDFLYTPDSGGGGGYYGGNIGNSSLSETKPHKSVSSSGSSYISGYKWCNSMSKTGVHTNSEIHYSNIVFEQAVMNNGNTKFLSPDGVLEEGHRGDGAIKITRIFICALRWVKYRVDLSLFLFLSIIP